MIACGVGMIAFGVFGFREAASEVSTFVPERQGASHGFLLRSGTVLSQSVFGRIFMFAGT